MTEEEKMKVADAEEAVALGQKMVDQAAVALKQGRPVDPEFIHHLTHPCTDQYSKRYWIVHGIYSAMGR